MKCALCRNGETQPGEVTVVLTREETTVVFKRVPASVCSNCGEYFLSRETTAYTLRRAQDAVESGTEVEIVRYAA